MTEPESKERKSMIVGAIEDIAEMRETREYERWLVEKDEENERVVKKMEEKRAIHINLISAAEMKAHTIEMRAEMDRKFVRCLMVAGLDTREAIRRVKVWSNEWDSEKHGR